MSNNVMRSICLDKTISLEYSSRVSIRVTVIMTVFILTFVFMIIRLVKFIIDRTKNGNVPAIFGRFQRNALTLSQILIQGVIISLFCLRMPMLIAMNLDFNLLRPLLFVSNLVVSHFILDFCLPIIALYNLYRNVPEFFYSNTSLVGAPRTIQFYVRNPTILPRVDVKNSLPLFIESHPVEEQEVPTQNNNPVVHVEIHHVENESSKDLTTSKSKQIVVEFKSRNNIQDITPVY